MERFHHPEIQEVVDRNRRVGVGITGCLQSPLFNPKILDNAYKIIQKENKVYSKELGIPESIRTTVVKPSGTLSLVGECTPGIHPAFSRYYIRRVRFASNDPLLSKLILAGHPIEPVIQLDGSYDHNTQVVSFYCETPAETPCSDEGFDTWKQLEAVLTAQKHWADQSVSITAYYDREDISQIKEWVQNNLKNIKTVSFLARNDHGFKQAPIEAIKKEVYEESTKTIKPIRMEDVVVGTNEIESLECAGGACPIK